MFKILYLIKNLLYRILMEKSFWESKPVNVNDTGDFRQILSNENLLEKINKELNESKVKLNYSILSDFTDIKFEEIVDFINNNYIVGGSNFKLCYTLDLFKFYCKNALVLEFYPKGKETIVGYIIGKKEKLNIKKRISKEKDQNKVNLDCEVSLIDILEVNFLCLTPKLRNLHVGPYMINCLTKESISNFNIGIAHYTINSPIKSPYISKKQFYHRMLNIDNLIKTKFISEDINEDSLKLLKNVFNTFEYQNTFKDVNEDRVILLKNSNQIDIKSRIYNLYKEYAKNTYDIHQEVSLEELNEILDNKDFYNFIILDGMDSTVAFISFFRLDTTTDNGTYKNGYYYKMFFKNENVIIDSLEFINEYIYKNDIFDVLTLTDTFKDLFKMKCVPGSGNLKYYLYNMSSSKIDNHKNGLVTI